MSQATPPSRPPYPSQDPLLPFTNHHNWQGSSAQNLHKIPTRVLGEPEGHRWAPLPDDLSHRLGRQKANVPSVLLVNPWHIHAYTVPHVFLRTLVGPLSMGTGLCRMAAERRAIARSACFVRHTRIREAMSAINSIMDRLSSQQDTRCLMVQFL